VNCERIGVVIRVELRERGVDEQVDVRSVEAVTTLAPALPCGRRYGGGLEGSAGARTSSSGRRGLRGGVGP
jgi:hypothetical protein